jgi:hypothetical protein
LRVYFSEENPQLQALEAIENTYTKQDASVLFLLEPQNRNVFTKDNLVAVEELRPSQKSGNWLSPDKNSRKSGLK